MNFSSQIPDIGVHSQLTLKISQICQKKECSAKTRFEFVEMNTDSLDPYLIGIVA